MLNNPPSASPDKMADILLMLTAAEPTFMTALPILAQDNVWFFFLDINGLGGYSTILDAAYLDIWRL